MILVSLATVGLWCANSALAPYLGDMGIIAILPMVAFYGFGILNKVILPFGPPCHQAYYKYCQSVLGVLDGLPMIVDGLQWCELRRMVVCGGGPLPFRGVTVQVVPALNWQH